MADVSRVTWLCQQLDPAQLLNMEPLPLSQSVLLSLMQQLGSDLSKVCLPDLSLTLLPHLRLTSPHRVEQDRWRPSARHGGCMQSIVSTVRKLTWLQESGKH